MDRSYSSRRSMYTDDRSTSGVDRLDYWSNRAMQGLAKSRTIRRRHENSTMRTSSHYACEHHDNNDADMDPELEYWKQRVFKSFPSLHKKDKELAEKEELEYWEKKANSILAKRRSNSFCDKSQSSFDYKTMSTGTMSTGTESYDSSPIQYSDSSFDSKVDLIVVTPEE